MADQHNPAHPIDTAFEEIIGLLNTFGFQGTSRVVDPRRSRVSRLMDVVEDYEKVKK